MLKFLTFFFLIYISFAGAQEIVPGKLIVKFKNHQQENLFADKIKNDDYFKSFNGFSITKKFPKHASPETYKLENGFVDLSLIYQIEIPNANLNKTLHYLNNFNCFEYAELIYKRDFLYTPNDPDQASQYHLALIKAFEAYDISKGDTNVVIGISDTGVDLAHPDLLDNIKRNYADPVDGIDNDFDGYVDNFMGWDLASNDNNPQYQAHVHGVHVSGISAATTDNATGISGVGFKCKFLPLKIMTETGYLTSGYESIVYAADHGCAIVNCSWGGTGYSKYEQDIVSYATLNQNCLVIGAAGNDNTEDLFFPASYKYVISVAATNQTDAKWTGSSYNDFVDVSAPGQQIYSTLGGGTYGLSSGTSMAAPVTAGAAAIIKAKFPLYNALQIAEVLKSTTDFIDTVNSPQYAGKLGTGRINLFNAITQNNKPGIILTNYTVTDKNDEFWINGDTLNIIGNFKNILANASNAIIQISCASGYVTVLNNQFIIGNLNGNDTVSNTNQPFKLILKNNIPPNHTFNVVFKYKADGYQSFESIEITANEDILNITLNDLKTSVSSKGYIGYNNYYQSQGIGVVYNQNNLLYNGSFIAGNAISQVSDNLPALTGLNDEDFYPLSKALRQTISPVSEFDVVSKYDDRMGSSSKLNISVKQSNYAWNNATDKKYIFYSYDIVNNGITPLGSVYAGIYADWDIKNPLLNKSSYTSGFNMVYANSSQPNSPYIGLKLLNHSSLCRYYSLDLIDDKNINLSNGFTSEEKFIMLTNNVGFAGTGAGTDIASFIGAGPFYMEPNDTVQVDIAMLVADSLYELLQTAGNAQEKYNNLFVGLSTQTINSNVIFYPNPANDVVNLTLPDKGIVELISIDGKITKSIPAHSKSLNLQVSELKNGCYFIKYHPENQTNQVFVKKLIIQR